MPHVMGCVLVRDETKYDGEMRSQNVDSYCLVLNDDAGMKDRRITEDGLGERCLWMSLLNRIEWRL